MSNKAEYLLNQHTQFAMALLSSKSIEDAAFSIGISTRTAQRYLSDERFKSILHSLQEQALAQTAVSLSSAATSAVATLTEIMQDDGNPSGVRARCADLILQSNLRYSELVSLGNRIKALESMRKGSNVTTQVIDTD